MRSLLILGLLAVPLLAGCLSGPAGPGTTAGEGGPAPVSHALPATVSGLQLVANANPNSTLGEWIDGDTAYLSGSSGLRIYDVSDPAQPVMLSESIDNTTGSRDVDVIHHPNGRTYAVVAKGGTASQVLVDVTDPRAPFTVTEVPLPGVHTVAVVPGTAVVYNSRSISVHVPGAGETGQVDIVDFTDPAHPKVKVFVFPAVVVTVGGTPRPVLSTTCHEMTFNAALARAYCAGVTDTTIWDVRDPLNPVILQVIDHPLVNIHHSVWDARNGTLLILGDEFAGVLAPTPTCSDKVSYPTSAVWFFDISDLALPKPLGYYQIRHDAVTPPEGGVPQYCSTHLGDVVEGRDLLVMGWYSAGVVVIDFSDPANAKTVAQWRSPQRTSVWEARYHNGHVFAADAVHGLDILKLV